MRVLFCLFAWRLSLWFGGFLVGEEGAGAVDIDAVAHFWNKQTLRRCHRLCVRQQGIDGTSLGWDSRPSCVVLFGDSFCSQQPLIGLRCQQAQFWRASPWKLCVLFVRVCFALHLSMDCFCRFDLRKGWRMRRVLQCAFAYYSLIVLRWPWGRMHWRRVTV